MTYDDHLYCPICGAHHVACWCRPVRDENDLDGYGNKVCGQHDPHEVKSSGS